MGRANCGGVRPLFARYGNSPWTLRPRGYHRTSRVTATFRTVNPYLSNLRHSFVGRFWSFTFESKQALRASYLRPRTVWVKGSPSQSNTHQKRYSDLKVLPRGTEGLDLFIDSLYFETVVLSKWATYGRSLSLSRGGEARVSPRLLPFSSQYAVLSGIATRKPGPA